MIEALLQAERLLVHGLVDQAEQIYRRTLDSDPLNAIAMVGLARVALERADDALAYRHACAALEIDRQNAAALRLEARLSEVLLARGEAVERPPWLAAGVAAADGAPEPASARVPVSTEPPRESERVVVARNPSMADHRQRMEQQASDHDTTAAGPGAAPAPAVPPDRAGAHEPAAGAAEPAAAPRRRPRGILRRLLGG